MKPWYAFLDEKNTDVIDTTYYNPSDFDWTKNVEENYKVIYDEIFSYVTQNENELKSYFATSMMNAPEKLKALSFYFWGLPMSYNAIKKCPETIALLEKVPHILSASVSILEPNAEIKPHYGDTDAVYRCHLPLVVPAGLPNCGFRVGYEDRAWEVGKLMIFNDAAYHKAWNYTGERRVVVLFDVLKPEFEKQKKWICAMVRGGIFWQFVSKSIPFLNGKKNIFSKAMSSFFAGLIYLFFGLFLNRKSSWL
jgi:aspartyl/asparaginyl beta-hydroxylase (cupin superfamily)